MARTRTLFGQLNGHKTYFRLLLPVCRAGTGREELWYVSPEFPSDSLGACVLL